jgi:hypothetical protein
VLICNKTSFAVCHSTLVGWAKLDEFKDLKEHRGGHPSFLSNHHSLVGALAHHCTSYWSSHSLAPGSRGGTELNAQCHAKGCPWLSCFSTDLNFCVCTHMKGFERIQQHEPGTIIVHQPLKCNVFCWAHCECVNKTHLN